MARGLHPSGYNDCLVFNANDLLRLDPGKDAARLSHTIGGRKRIQIIAKASEMGVKVLNPGKLSASSQIKYPKADSSGQVSERTENH